MLEPANHRAVLGVQLNQKILASNLSLIKSNLRIVTLLAVFIPDIWLDVLKRSS